MPSDRVLKTPRDDHPFRENGGTQAPRSHPVFANPAVVAEGWVPACPKGAVRPGRALSVLLTWQRVVIWRGADGTLRALDAFCPHMGADLGNGRVRGDDLECYFHQWRFGGDGCLKSARCSGPLPRVRTRAWPVAEKYGWIWVHAGDTPSHPIPDAPGLEGGEVLAWHLASPLLFAHHHVMMAGGIDLQHFASVHDFDVAFDLQVRDRGQNVVDFVLRGSLPSRGGWRVRLGRWLLGDHFGYDARFAGGSVVALTYGPEQRFGGRGRRLPPLHILWGCVAEQTGVSRVHVFLLTRRRRGLWGALGSRLLLLATAALLSVLRDDDVEAFPHMRFQLGPLLEADHAVARLVRFLDGLPLSPWSRSGRDPKAGP